MKAYHVPLLVASLFFPPLALFLVADVLRNVPDPSDMYRIHYPTDW